MIINHTELNNVELTEFVRVHNAAIAYHEQWLTEQQQSLSQTSAILAEVSKQQAQTAATQAISLQEIAEMRAGILDLRNLVADYIQGRSQT